MAHQQNTGGPMYTVLPNQITSTPAAPYNLPSSLPNPTNNAPPPSPLDASIFNDPLNTQTMFINFLQAQLHFKDQQILQINATNYEQVIIIRKQQEEIAQMKQQLQTSQNITNVQYAHNVPHSTHRSSPPMEKKETFPKSVVITNIDESTGKDEAEKQKNDKNIITAFIKEIDEDAEIDTIRRMGTSDTTKTRPRPIEVKFKKSNHKQNVIKKAANVIKANHDYKSKHIFVNNMIPKEAHQIQIQLKKELKQFREDARSNNASNMTYSIHNNLIHAYDSNDNSDVVMDITVNKKAAVYYKISSFRQQPNSESAMEFTSA